MQYVTDDSAPYFQCPTNAAFADDSPTRKSTEGYLFKLFGGPIDWCLPKKKQVNLQLRQPRHN